jgi:methyltransferase (TIGR00027 family)
VGPSSGRAGKMPRNPSPTLLPNVQTGQRSRTAEYMAFFRAVESRRPSGRRLFADPLALTVLDRPLRAAAVLSSAPLVGGIVPWVVDRRWPGPRPSAVARTKVIDDWLGAALEAGLDQLVVLGAGYDSRAYRIAGAERLAVFEVDHPDTQVRKRGVLEERFGGVPAQTRLVPLDFERGSLEEALKAAGFRSGARTFTIWEGVASYLTPEAVDATLRWAATSGASESQLALTYVHRGLIDGTVDFPHAGPWVESVNRAGEPFVFGFDPASLPEHVAPLGLRVVEDLSTTGALERLGLPSSRVPGFYRVALLEVTGVPAGP